MKRLIISYLAFSFVLGLGIYSTFSGDTSIHFVNAILLSTIFVAGTMVFAHNLCRIINEKNS
jgi:hypothetical protein